MPLQATSGAASYDGYGGGVPFEPIYIEQIFATHLYTGNGSTQTITNGIDLAGKGGLVWVKKRDSTTVNASHYLVDTVRGAGNYLSSNSTNASASDSQISAFNSNGFYIGSDGANVNLSGSAYASWTFRKQPKFFDVVTYTGNGTTQNIAHNLGSVPGCIIVKRTNLAANWFVWHRGLTAGYWLLLNDTQAQSNASSANVFGNNTTYVDPTSTVFTVGNGAAVNASGGTYVAYLFAHDAGGFGLSGSDNVISCGSFSGTGGGSTTTVTLGYEPQWVMVKCSSDANGWEMYDSMRGMVVGVSDKQLLANTSTAESTVARIEPTATGFIATDNPAAGTQTYIYIAIRRGPMKTPTSGTSVFGLNARSGTGANATVTGGQVDDAVLVKNRGSAVASLFSSRLTGTGYLVTSSTAAEVAAGTTILQANPWDVMDGVKVGTTSTITNASSNTFINYLFQRAPGFFDVVCYTGTGSNTTVTHNLGVVPELIIVKRRNAAGDNWCVYSAPVGAAYRSRLNTNDSLQLGSSSAWNNTAPTASVFSVGTESGVNASGGTFVAYLAASLAGVSKIGSYVGNGGSQTINCGFASGARFVMIRAFASTNDWLVWDSASGIVASNDPHLALNDTAAQITTDDSVDADSSGFVVNQNTATNINVNGASFLYWAIA